MFVAMAAAFAGGEGLLGAVCNAIILRSFPYTRIIRIVFPLHAWAVSIALEERREDQFARWAGVISARGFGSAPFSS